MPFIFSILLRDVAGESQGVTRSERESQGVTRSERESQCRTVFGGKLRHVLPDREVPWGSPPETDNSEKTGPAKSRQNV